MRFRRVAKSSGCLRNLRATHRLSLERSEPQTVKVDGEPGDLQLPTCMPSSLAVVPLRLKTAPQWQRGLAPVSMTQLAMVRAESLGQCFHLTLSHMCTVVFPLLVAVPRTPRVHHPGGSQRPPWWRGQKSFREASWTESRLKACLCLSSRLPQGSQWCLPW